jgi:hypothetical protein
VGHPGNVEVFDDDDVEPAGELVGKLVMGVLADRCDRSVKSRPPSEQLRPVPRSALAASYGPIERLQSCEPGCDRARVGNVPTVVGNTVDRP